MLPLYVLMVLVSAVVQDAPPSTDIWLIEGPVAEPFNVTDRDGYDNQPAFTRDGTKLLYTSSRDGQTDIYVYDLADKRSRRLTSTKESEYSPTPMEGGGFSVVRVEEDGKQRLWAFDDEGKSPRLLLEDVEPVGYHAWLDAETLALFVLGDPPTLRVSKLKDGSTVTLAQSIGRSLHRTPDGALAYVDKSEEAWVLRKRDVAAETSEASEQSQAMLAPTRPGREDFALTPAGDVLMADGAILYVWSRENESWSELYDLSSKGITNITRIALGPDGAIAFVADR